MIQLLLITLQVLEVNVYRFERGSVEIWYRLPISVLQDSVTGIMPGDSTEASYSYWISIHNEDGTDSASIEGRKSLYVRAGDVDDFVIDYLPLALYAGRFRYDLRVYAGSDDYHDRGVIEIAEDSDYLSCSDMVLGTDSFGRFLFRDMPILPALGSQFTPDGRLVSYLEVYGLVPDSLHYSVEWWIQDQTGATLLHDKKKVLKYDYVQVDTHSVELSKFVPGEYRFATEINDPASASKIACSAAFSIASPVPLAGHESYRDIHYLISANEYQKFLKLSETEKEIYLKEFWLHNDYAAFEEGLAEADRRFSTGKLKGRDSERGRLFVKLGPPDEIEIISMTMWSRPFEVWHYYAKNDFLFCDTRNDHNPRLLKILKPGELTKLLETGMRNGTRQEDWMSEMAPGTYDWQEDMESPE